MNITTLPLAEIVTKIDYGLTAAANKTQVGPKFLRITDIQDDAVDWSNVPFCEAGPKKLAKARIERGDIVFARTGATTGKSFLINDPPADAVFASYLIRVRPSDKADPLYLAHFFRSQNYWSQIKNRTRGAAQGGVNATSLSELRVPLPPLEEQRRIAGILDAADALRRRRHEALALLDTLPGAIFSEMFGALTTSDRFPRGPLSNLVTGFDTGKNLAPASEEEGTRHRVLKVSAVTKGEFIEAESKPLPADYLPPEAHFVRPGDLLFSRANTSALIGATAMVEEVSDNIVLPDKIWRFCLNEEKAEPIFLHYLFGTRKFRDEVSKRATGSSGSMKNISKGKVLSIEVGQPPVEMQREFSRRVRIARGMRSQVSEHLSELETLFASLQSRAFAGEL